MKKWVINKPDETAAKTLMKAGGLTAAAAGVLVSRGYDTVEKASDFFVSDGNLSDPFLVADMKEAADIINDAVDNGSKICIFGDYDCDGIVSTAMLFSYLDAMGAVVTAHIPEREEGYGMSEEAVRRIAEDGTELIITVDNGISAINEAKLIKELGMKLVITDHHQAGTELPEADAVVDPHRSDDYSPFKQLCGAGVVLKLLAALDGGDYSAASEQFGDLAAIATIADIVELSGENRIIVADGIEYLKNTENAGLSALMEVAGVKPESVNSTAVAYMIAPRINAAGRFGTPTDAFNMLLTEDPDEALELANKLSGLNLQRKETEKVIMADIETMIAENPSLLQKRVLVFSKKGWHHGVIGIVSAKITEKYGKPSIILSGDETEVRGSARSFGDFSVFRALTYCADLLVRFGGHNGAGGMTVTYENLDAFDRKMQEYAASLDIMPKYTVRADMIINPARISVEEVKGLEILEPFGEGNPSPQFALTGCKVGAVIPLSNGIHSKIKLNVGDSAVYVLCFGVSPDKLPFKTGETADFIVSLGISSYNGKDSVSIKAIDYRKSGINQAKYFAAADTYEKIKLGENTDPRLKPRILPERAHLETVYRAVPPSFTAADNVFAAIASDELNYCRFRLCVDIFEELGLIDADFANGLIKRTAKPQKRDINSSRILQELRCL